MEKALPYERGQMPEAEEPQKETNEEKDDWLGAGENWL